MKGILLSDPRAFIPYWFEDKKLKVQGNLILSADNRSFEASLVFNAMWLDYKDEIRAYGEQADGQKFRGFPEADCKKALEEFFEIKRVDAINEIRSKLACTGESLDELKRFLVAATGKCDEIELVMLAHLIWQVKRKMFNRKVKDHVMVIFKGKQGAGKTEAIRVLFRPIQAWFSNASLKEITDDRWKFFFKNSYVIFCDELQHAQYADVDALKNIISADIFTSRRLGLNIYDNVVQNCSFVGATNKSVGELIRDNTGMRRFFQVETLSKMNWEEINSIDTLKIWQGIDENREIPYIIPYREKIAQIQSDLIVLDPDEDFLQSFQLLSGAKDQRTSFIPNSDLYAAYILFVRHNGERQKPSNAFHRKIKGIGMKDFEERQGPKGTRGYAVTQESAELIAKFKASSTFY